MQPAAAPDKNPYHDGCSPPHQQNSAQQNVSSNSPSSDEKKKKWEDDADAEISLAAQQLTELQLTAIRQNMFEQAFDSKLYSSVFSIFEVPADILLQIYPESFMQGLITNSICEEAEFNIQKQEGCETYFFEGYPSGNYIKQICVVLTLWNKLDRFPVLFQPLACLSHHDETEEVVEMLGKLTPQLKYVFRELENCDDELDSNNPQSAAVLLLQKELRDFFVAMQPRGILTLLGVRRTNSSIDEELPPEKNQLIL